MKELIEKWRKDARLGPGGACVNSDARRQAKSEQLKQCANELEAALKPRPIESAPTDGTSILLFGRHWNEPANRWDTGWIEGKWFDDEAHKTQNWFTHWLPLPPKPPMPMDGGEE